MLLASSAAVLDTEDGGNAFIPSGCSGKRSPDSEAIGRNKPVAVAALSRDDRERVLADFAKLYVGPAHGIDKAELEAVDGQSQRIVAYVYDWNGILNIPSSYQGIPVAFTLYVPQGGLFQV